MPKYKPGTTGRLNNNSDHRYIFMLISCQDSLYTAISLTNQGPWRLGQRLFIPEHVIEPIRIRGFQWVS